MCAFLFSNKKPIAYASACFRDIRPLPWPLSRALLDRSGTVARAFARRGVVAHWRSGLLAEAPLASDRKFD